MKIVINDSRNETRRFRKTRDIDGNDVSGPHWGTTGREGEWRDDADTREVVIRFEDDDFDTAGVPRVLQGSRKGKHDGRFFVRSVRITFSRSYSYKDSAWNNGGELEENQHGWSRGHMAVGGVNRLQNGGEGVNTNGTGYPKVHEVDDTERPFTFDNWRKQLTFSGDLRVLKEENIQNLDDLRAAVANFDNEGKAYRKHPLAYELRLIEEGERGERFFQKRVTDPLPEWLQVILDRVHPATGDLGFAEPEEHRYGTFPDKRTATV